MNLFFESFYNSFYQQPLTLWIATLIGASVLYTIPSGLKKSPELRFFSLIWIFISLLDAGLTATPVPGVGRLSWPWDQLVPLTFVLLGDYRYFLWSSGLNQSSWILSRQKYIGALKWTLIVPIASKIAVALLPQELANISPNSSRFLFFFYEVFFLCLIPIHARTLMSHGRLSPTSMTWFRRVKNFAVLYYSLWAFADLWILALEYLNPAEVQLRDFGFLMRVVPNVLYYGFLIPMISLLKPKA